MSGIFGHLNASDSERAFSATVGQQLLFEAATNYINRANAELAMATSIFISRTTDAFKFRYLLPGGGYLQTRGNDGRYGAVKAVGSWDVAFPLDDYGAMIVGNDVDMAYMTVGELDRHVSTVVNQNVNTVRHQMLRRIFKSTTDSYVDRVGGTITIQPLANGDAVTFPPVIGSATEATENHYLESGYAESAISDTNDPYEVVVPELEEHFGQVVGGSNIISFINDTARAETQALTDFFEVNDNFIRTGANTDVPINLPSVPGRIIGRHKAGTWISVWNFIPANYLVSVHLEADPPLIRRVDPADTGLGDGLQLVAQNEEFPFEESIWRHRFGLGAGDRLNGVVMEFGTGGTYSIPAAYSV